jgi:hypothetical protein
MSGAAMPVREGTGRSGIAPTAMVLAAYASAAPIAMAFAGYTLALSGPQLPGRRPPSPVP